MASKAGSLVLLQSALASYRGKYQATLALLLQQQVSAVLTLYTACVWNQCALEICFCWNCASLKDPRWCGTVEDLLSAFPLPGSGSRITHSQDWDRALTICVIPILWTSSCACLRQALKICTVRHLLVLIFQSSDCLEFWGRRKQGQKCHLVCVEVALDDRVATSVRNLLKWGKNSVFNDIYASSQVP